MAAALGDLQIGQMAGRGGVAGLDAAIGVGRGLMNQRGGAVRLGPGQELGQGGKIVHPDEQIDFREVLRELRAIALHQAAGHHQANLRPVRLQAGQIQDGVHRLFTGRLDEAAGIDQQEIGGGRLPGDLPAGPGEAPQHDFRVHQVLGAAQADGEDGFRFSVFGFRFQGGSVGFEVISRRLYWFIH